MSEVETDGRVLDCGRDPPGQSSVYIPPGDSFREVYRLTTFARFPDYIPVNPCLLARHGFMYTGFKDRTKCFRCGRIVENWMAADDVTSSRWHAPDCELVTGVDSDNVPIGIGLRSRQQVESPERESEPEEHGPGQSLEQHVQVAAGPEEAESTEGQGENGSSTSLFPCLDPVNPHMQEGASRLATFRDSIANWPSHRIDAPPEEMVEAGLYYLGERDRVKCWYCNGGLQNWDRYDSPWFEHAKWFPSCEYLLQKKGPEYVHNVVAQYPNINRPTPVNASRALNLPQAQSSGGSHQTRSNMPAIVDPRENVRKLERKVDEEMRRSPFVDEAKTMGFSDKEVRFAMLRRFEEFDSPYPSLASMIEYIIGNQHKIPKDEHGPHLLPAVTSSTSSSSQSVVEELRRLRHERICKVCNHVPANVVLLPCGHLAACTDCCRNLPHCPLCQSVIRESLISYIV